MQIEEAFRKLREEWFMRHLYSRDHERDSEDDDRAKYREEGNKELKAKYDEQTEAIIKGADKPIAPTCSYDMDKK